jgi:hypothetical protein
MPAAAAFAAARTFRDDHFHPNVLEDELIVDHSEKFNRALIGHVRASHLDTSPFPCQFRMCFGAFAVQKKRSVGVKTFLEFVQPRVRSVPRVGLIHNQDCFVSLLVVTDKIDNADARALLLRDRLILHLVRVGGRWTPKVARSSRP